MHIDLSVYHRQSTLNMEHFVQCRLLNTCSILEQDLYGCNYFFSDLPRHNKRRVEGMRF